MLAKAHDPPFVIFWTLQKGTTVSFDHDTIEDQTSNIESAIRTLQMDFACLSECDNLEDVIGNLNGLQAIAWEISRICTETVIDLKRGNKR
jgi:hypothetical protein